jgi:type III pantothenate kinase
MISVDAGNTRIKVLIFNQDGSVQYQRTWQHSAQKECEAWLQTLGGRILICDSSGGHWNVGTVVTAHAPWSFEVDYAETVGVDRLAAVEGARTAYPNGALLLVSLGTCLTYSYLSRDGRFQGGSIAPGWSSRLKAMHEHTGSLPDLEAAIELGSDPRTRTTTQSMTRGAAQGMVDEINAEIERFEKINPELTVLVTGGDGPTFVNHLKKGIFADENWVARGLWALAHE